MTNLEGIKAILIAPVPKFTAPICTASQENVRPERISTHLVYGPCVVYLYYLKFLFYEESYEGIFIAKPLNFNKNIRELPPSHLPYKYSLLIYTVRNNYLYVRSNSLGRYLGKTCCICEQIPPPSPPNTLMIHL